MHIEPVRATPLKLMCSYIYEGKTYKEIYIVDSEQLLVEISYPFAPSEEERNIIESLMVNPPHQLLLLLDFKQATVITSNMRSTK